ncbi:MAG: FAD-dependent oxidoreductase [Myxococcales bacterium]|nr:FAD-dependent oxidoreductase [Myxococcales bacterium]
MVVGAGITGAGIARDASMRGFRVLVLEAADVAFGTSSRSSRLIHGGVRYLERGELGLVFEALRERERLYHTAGHLVRPARFLFPAYQGDRLPLWKLRVGLSLYDALSFYRAAAHRSMGAIKAREMEPLLAAAGLRGAVSYEDALTDDARLTLTTLQSARCHGAEVLTYAPVRAITKPAGGELLQVALDDAQVHARAVIVATGPWTSERLLGEPGRELLTLSRGVHLVVRRDDVPVRQPLVVQVPDEQRIVFVVPWGARTYLGTTDTAYVGDPARASVEDADLEDLFGHIGRVVPAARLSRDRIVSAWSGVRPLVRPSRSRSLTGATVEVSRRHRILVNELGVIGVVGGKLTTFRAMAEEAVERALRGIVGGKLPPCETHRAPLVDGAPLLLAAAREAGVIQCWSLVSGRARALVGHAGPARALDFGPDGRVLASAGDDGVVRLWNMSDGSSTNLTDHEGPVLALRWSPDGETLASAGADGSVILWSPARATHVELREHRKPVRELAFVGDGALLSLDAAGHVFEWNLATRRGAERHDLAGARGLHVARGGDTRLTVARDDARVLQFPARSSSRALLGDPARLSAAALSRGGEWAALATSAGELELWSASEETAELLFSPDIMIDRLAFAPDGDALATSNRAGALTLWSLTGGEHQPLTQGGPHHAQLEFSPDGRWLAALSDAHELDRWPRAPDGVAGPRRRWLEQGERFASGPLTWAPDSESVALDHCDTMCVIERVFVDDRPPIRFPRPCFGPPTTLRFSGDGRRLVGDSPRDEAPFVWDFEQARALTARWRPEFDADARRLAIAFVDAGAQLRIATAREQAAGETLRVWSWNLETGRTHLLFEERALRHVSASPNAPTLLLRTGELRNLLWSLDDDRLHVLPTIEGGIVDFLTDLDRSHALIRARGPDSERADIHRLLELETGVERDLPPLHEPIAFSPDRSLADALPRAGVRLWRSAGPEDPARFQEWLAEVTTRELERAAIP